MNRVPMTVYGAEKLKEELARLKGKDRQRITAAIAEARALGDLKENAEYHAAREQQSFNEGRIMELEAKLSNAQVIDVTRMENTGRVIFGATVVLLDVEADTKVTYQIVGEDEADIKLGKVSVSSPLARALVGKEVTDEVVVRTPAGETSYEIVQVDYV